MSEQYYGDEQQTGPAHSTPDSKKSPQKRASTHNVWKPVGAAIVAGALAAGAVEYFAFYKPDTADAQETGNKKLTAGLELGQLGFTKDLLRSISDFQVDKKGQVSGKAHTGDKKYPTCDVTYDMGFDSSKNAVTFKLPPVEDAAGNRFGDFVATTPDAVKTRTAELCEQQAVNLRNTTSSLPPSK